MEDFVSEKTTVLLPRAFSSVHVPWDTKIKLLTSRHCTLLHNRMYSVMILFCFVNFVCTGVLPASVSVHGAHGGQTHWIPWNESYRWL